MVSFCLRVCVCVCVCACVCVCVCVCVYVRVSMKMLSLCRSPALKEMEWYKLHDDIMTLHDIVYRCLSPTLCHQVCCKIYLDAGKKYRCAVASKIDLHINSRNCPQLSKPVCSVHVEFIYFFMFLIFFLSKQKMDE